MSGTNLRVVGWLLGAAVAGLCALGLASPANAATTDFITTWKTDNAGTSTSTQVKLPLEADGEYNFAVDWESDGTVDETITAAGQGVHTYPTAGTYQVTISFPDPTSKLKGWRFNNSGDVLKILSVDQWGGKMNLGNKGFYFSGAANLTSNATDGPDLTGTTTLTWMFVGALQFNGDVSSWVTSGVTDMSFMFYGNEAFNQDIGGWDTGSVTNMNSMLYGTTVFNQDLGNWNTQNVTDMGFMFYLANAFNQDISTWDTSKVTDMSYMFNRAGAFNQDISTWDTGEVTDMTYMFFNAFAFNQNLGGWDVGKITAMLGMFETDDLPMALSTANYSKTLVGWGSQSPLQSNVTLGAPDITYYCAAASARNTLIAFHNWTITDGGEEPGNCFETTWDSTNTSAGSSASGKVQLPLEADGVYDFIVDWGDDTSGVITSWNQSEVTHDYGAGTWTIRISGTLKGWRFNNSGDRLKLLDIKRWGGLNLGNNRDYFNGASNLDISATDTPDLNGTTDLGNAFRSASKLTGGLSTWDIGEVTMTDGMFAQAEVFNEDIGGWDTSKVTDMSAMFSGADMFNQDIGGWDTGNVISLSNMFGGAESFNQDIGGWDTGSATNLSGMFVSATAFNQDISGWRTSNATTLFAMFSGATAFNQDLGPWDIGNVADMRETFDGTGLSTTNYDSVLIGWAGRPSVLNDVGLGAAGIRYSCAAKAARQTLIDSRNWTIIDGGAGPCVTISPDPVAVPSTTVGRNSSVTVTILNPGGADLVLPVSAVSVTGVDAGQFGLSDDSCWQTTVAAGASCTVKVRFSPTATGNKKAVLTVASNALSSPDSAPLSGTGVLPGFKVSPGALDFGINRVGTSSNPQSVTVTNDGSGPLGFPAGAVTVNGDGFMVTTDVCSNSVLKPGDNCSVTVTFSPATKGLRSGQLVFVSDAAGSPHSVGLSGRGSPAPLKKKQRLSVKLPKRIKRSGLTLITPANATTNAGQLVRTLVTGRPIQSAAAGQLRYFTVVRGPNGKTSVRTFGYPNLKIRVTQKAPATQGYTAFSRPATYIRGAKN